MAHCVNGYSKHHCRNTAAEEIDGSRQLGKYLGGNLRQQRRFHEFLKARENPEP